jgi:enolase
MPAPVFDRPQRVSSSAAIVAVHGRQVLDSRGAPTLEVEVRLESGACGRAIVPAGASVGPHEAVEWRDHTRSFRGRAVRTAVRHVGEQVSGALAGRDAMQQRAIDRVLIELDGTIDKHRLGANTLLGASLACVRAAAAHEDLPLWRFLGGQRAHVLPVPMLTVLSGGAHARNAFDLQEVMVVPWAAESFADALHVAVQVYWSLGDLLAERGHVTAIGDTGGFAPNVPSIEAALELVETAIERVGHHAGDDVAVAVDAAAGQWRADGGYRLVAEQLTLSRERLVDRWVELASRYPIAALEDPIGPEDPAGWSELRGRLGDRVQIVGDDLFATNPDLVRQGVDAGLATAVLIKPNQVGTLTEALDAIAIARDAGWGVIVSHRSGETEDTTIADLAVAIGAGQIKAGGPCRGERVAKYNRLLRIEERIGDDALFAGRQPFAHTRSAARRP